MAYAMGMGKAADGEVAAAKRYRPDVPEGFPPGFGAPSSSRIDFDAGAIPAFIQAETSTGYLQRVILAIIQGVNSLSALGGQLVKQSNSHADNLYAMGYSISSIGQDVQILFNIERCHAHRR